MQFRNRSQQESPQTSVNDEAWPTELPAAPPLGETVVQVVEPAVLVVAPEAIAPSIEPPVEVLVVAPVDLGLLPPPPAPTPEKDLKLLPPPPVASIEFTSADNELIQVDELPEPEVVTDNALLPPAIGQVAIERATQLASQNISHDLRAGYL